MVKNVVFSIVAKNYLPLAYTQGAAIKKYNRDIDFCILVSDTVEGFDYNKEPFKIYSLPDILIPSNEIQEMAFKYNITEFCTAVKPYFFDFLFQQGYEKAIYFDPDICTFGSVEAIFSELDKYSIVVTPHFFTPEVAYTGTITETLLLHVGGFNFGFVAVSNSQSGIRFIKWWKNRLFQYCYQDKIEALHTDQKWGDLIPSFFYDSLLVSNDLGRNMSFWNLHERRLDNEGDRYIIENRITKSQTNDLLFYHFAGFDKGLKSNRIHKNHIEYTFDDYPEIKTLYKWYDEQLEHWGYDRYIKMPYGYNFYQNGLKIKYYHRRIYRRLVDEGHKFHNPFDSQEKDGFFSLLQSNNLLGDSSNEKMDKATEQNFPGFESKLKKINWGMKWVKRILGTDKYFLLLKFMQRYSRVENQTFLIREERDNYKFLNENRQYTKK